MNISETTKSLPDDERLYCQAVVSYVPLDVTTDDLKRLIDALEKCETAIDSLSTGDLGFGSDDKTWWALRDELLSEIREALGK